MDEDNQINQEPLEKQKLDQLEDELGNIEKKMTQGVPPQPNQSVQQTDTPQPISPPSSADFKPQGLGKSKGILWIGVVLLALALVGVGAYYLGSRRTTPTINPESTPTQTPTPSPDPTADWKTYTDEVNGWSVKYPQGWKLQENAPSSLNDDWYERIKSVVLYDSVDPNKGAINIRINADHDYTLQEWLNNVDRDNPEPLVEHEDGYYLGVEIPNQTNYVLGGNPALRLKYDLGKIQGDCIYTAKNGLIYDICPTGEEGEMVLSSFKFIEATPSATTTP